MARANRTCNTCPTVITSGSRCHRCTRAADIRRGTAHQRGYTSPGHQAFRRAVLQRDPICVTPDCHSWATIADHWPLSRRDLIEQHHNPNDPQHGRGLCKRHHDQSTSTLQPGGWNTL